MDTSQAIERPQTELSVLVTQAQDYAKSSRAENSVRAYTADWKSFKNWCQARGVESLPAEPGTLQLYLTDRAATWKVSTLQRNLSSIVKAHKMAGKENPVTEPVRAVWEGIRRTKGIAPNQKAAAVTDEIKQLVAVTGDNLKGTRDRALILVGFAGALRRAELVALDVADVEFKSEGALITIRQSKTDQEGAGAVIGIPYGSNVITCPVRALMAWLEASKITEGAIFRKINRHGHMGDRLTDQSVALIVKGLAEKAGLDASRYSGHSLRAGFTTSAAIAKLTLEEIMGQTRHKTPQVVLSYVRRANIFTDNAAGRVGL